MDTFTFAKKYIYIYDQFVLPMEHNRERVIMEFHDSSSSKKKVKHTPKAAKHRVMKFKNHLLGVVEKTNSSQIKQLWLLEIITFGDWGRSRKRKEFLKNPHLP